VPPTEAARPNLILRMTSIAARVKPFSSGLCDEFNASA
jgi:hypothetical protein